MIQNAQTESDAYTVLYTDVVWTSEFAANQWIEPLPADEFPLDANVDAINDTAMYNDQLYAVPFASDGGLLYYRTDLMKAAGIAEPPTTWDELKADCDKIQATPEGKDVNCYAGQFEKYEGLTVNFGEAVASSGGVITEPDGTPNVDTPEALEGLTRLVDWFEDGTIPEEAITYDEEIGRQAFQAGELIFHRQWPYQYGLANATDGSSKVAGDFDVAPLPGDGDNPGASSLGGHNLAISEFAENKATALDFIKYMTTEEYAAAGGQAGIPRPHHRGALHRPGAGQGIPVPACPRRVRQHRGAAAARRPLRRRDRGHPGRGLRGPDR